MASHELDSVLHYTYDTSFELSDAYNGYLQRDVTNHVS